MSDTTAGFDLSSEDTLPAAPRKTDWPLMSDIVSARYGMPDHLIRWNRAKGEDDPKFQR